MDNSFDDDNALWQMATSKVAPLKSKSPENKTKANTELPKQPIIINNPPPAPPAPPSVKLQSGFVEAGDTSRIDGSIAQKLKDGSYPIDAKLDLHGRTQDEAYEALRYCITAAYGMGKRCILVITGKGVDGHGVLRENLPKWLNSADLGGYILTYSHAAQQHGDTGAFYILLRKNR